MTAEEVADLAASEAFIAGSKVGENLVRNRVARRAAKDVSGRLFGGSSSKNTM